MTRDMHVYVSVIELINYIFNKINYKFIFKKSTIIQNLKVRL